MKSAVILLVSLSAVLALKCYSGHSGTDDDYKPDSSNQTTCIGSKSLCIKTTTSKVLGKEMKSATFGCDNAGLACSTAGIKAGECTSPTDGTRVCCCDSELCNSSPMGNILLPCAILAVVYKVLM